MNDYFQDTMRLYFKSDNEFRYMWVYVRERWIIVDEGFVGQMRDHQLFAVDRRAEIDALIKTRRDAGYAEISEEQMTYHDVVFAIAGSFADEEELDHRNLIWDELDVFLGITGQGWTDGASSGMGTMTIGVAVVDAETFKVTVADWIAEKGLGEIQTIVDYGAYE